ncbi:hypothetical protein DFJ73DRAFT_466660 [Zopfochytrium polystomum]|nr:hypothetical protein DFJ73DRAFT_466660 [Zopfochytrium polystomum]
MAAAAAADAADAAASTNSTSSGSLTSSSPWTPGLSTTSHSLLVAHPSPHPSPSPAPPAVAPAAPGAALHAFLAMATSSRVRLRDHRGGTPTSSTTPNGPHHPPPPTQATPPPAPLDPGFVDAHDPDDLGAPRPTSASRFSFQSSNAEDGDVGNDQAQPQIATNDDWFWEVLDALVDISNSLNKWNMSDCM